MNDGKPLFSTAHPTPKRTLFVRLRWPIINLWWSWFGVKKSSLEQIEIRYGRKQKRNILNSVFNEPPK